MNYLNCLVARIFFLLLHPASEEGKQCRAIREEDLKGCKEESCQTFKKNWKKV